MEPDRTNYEIWLIDYLDGNLNSSQVEQLMSFLDDNPDIKNEFTEITQYSIRPENQSYSRKKSLKRNASEIVESQFEYLCIAASENDLTRPQVAEVEEMIAESPRKRKTYELYRKLKLTAPEIQYSKKYKLRKQTVVQQIFRLSLIGFSVAATVAIFISLYSIFIKKNPLENPGFAYSNLADTITIMTDPVRIAVKSGPAEKKVTESSPARVLSSLRQTIQDTMKSNFTTSIIADSSVLKPDIAPVLLSKIDFIRNVNLTESLSPVALVAMNITLIYDTEADERSGFSRFIARILRDKILKTIDQEKGRLKAYEIADAGILGLNKLFGWKMSLQKNKNEKGEIKSFYFSSKLLKFNVPVKKTTPMP